MIRTFFILFAAVLLSTTAFAQTKGGEQQELERQRQELKNEIDQAQQQLDQTRQSTKASKRDYIMASENLNRQERVLKNINKELSTIDNTITNSQRDVRRMSFLLDTLKQEYTNSMIYSYKNRSNVDFLNFILSASSFNDAVKRITYLKNYRSYRELQGENIIRTQQLLKTRIDELAANKQKKSSVLETQNKEISVLADQQKQKNDILQKLKAQGVDLNNQIADKQRQMRRVSAAIAAAIKKAQEDARREALVTAAADKEKAKKDAEAARKLAAENPTTTTTTTVVTKPIKAKPEPVKQVSVLLNSTNIVTNTSFEKNRGYLPWPVDRGSVLMHYGNNNVGKLVMNVSCISIGSDIGTPVKSVFDGVISAVKNADDVMIVIIQHGKYFSTYTNIGKVSVQKGQVVKTGQVIGEVQANDDGVGALDFYISTETADLNPEQWLRRR
ncbi:MAG TPA: peptidoglycan DD-metalloendopeptidase family protein [Ferruginibacter sp.]|jgi:septal ring factor EnvC (AmiA/AmiB activator)|nr:peptidoglycan DD-metalloendopeptidase family protein [Ferruginibacter sp.]